MGLDVSHDAWHGAYSAFSRWRQKIAELAGYAVWDVVYDGGYKTPTIMLDWGHITEENLNGKWYQMPADPLILIFAHHDCEGTLPWQFCKALADRLTELMPLLATESDNGGHIGNWCAKTQQFINGCLSAYEAQEDLHFG